MFKRPRPIKNLPSWIFLIILSLFVLAPLAIIISQSLMGNQEINRWPPKLITFTPLFENYANMFQRQDLELARWLVNSPVRGDRLYPRRVRHLRPGCLRLRAACVSQATTCCFSAPACDHHGAGARSPSSPTSC